MAVNPYSVCLQENGFFRKDGIAIFHRTISIKGFGQSERLGASPLLRHPLHLNKSTTIDGSQQCRSIVERLIGDNNPMKVVPLARVNDDEINLIYPLLFHCLYYWRVSHYHHGFTFDIFCRILEGT